MSGDKWYAGVLAPNGKIYAIPWYSTSVLIIDPLHNTADTTCTAGLSRSNRWVGGALASNGKIHGIPRDADSVLIIDSGSNGSFCEAVACCAYFHKFQPEIKDLQVVLRQQGVPSARRFAELLDVAPGVPVPL